jgi:hypothetical protein
LEELPNEMGDRDMRQMRVSLANPSSISQFRFHNATRSLRAGFALAFLLICLGQTAAATDPCQSITDQIASLRTELQNKKDDFRDTDGGRDSRKPLASKINQLERDYEQRIRAKQQEYDQCRLAHGGKLDQVTTFTGTATMTTTNHNAPGPFVQRVTIGMTFLKYDHTKVDLTSFPTITTAPFTTPVGSNTTTVTLLSVQSTSVNPTTGKVSVTMTMHFRHSLAGAGDSDLPITISTENTGGSHINTGTRALTLAGTGTFLGGFLGGSNCTLTISGSLSALP